VSGVEEPEPANCLIDFRAGMSSIVADKALGVASARGVDHPSVVRFPTGKPGNSPRWAYWIDSETVVVIWDQFRMSLPSEVIVMVTSAHGQRALATAGAIGCFLLSDVERDSHESGSSPAIRLTDCWMTEDRRCVVIATAGCRMANIQVADGAVSAVRAFGTADELLQLPRISQQHQVECAVDRSGPDDSSFLYALVAENRLSMACALSVRLRVAELRGRPEDWALLLRLTRAAASRGLGSSIVARSFASIVDYAGRMNRAEELPIRRDLEYIAERLECSAQVDAMDSLVEGLCGAAGLGFRFSMITRIAARNDITASARIRALRYLRDHGVNIRDVTLNLSESDYPSVSRWLRDHGRQ
jgi:hypothetical protein